MQNLFKHNTNVQCKSNRRCDICGNDTYHQQNNWQQEKFCQKRSHVATSKQAVLLATALVKIVDGMGTTTLRALIDTGSQLSLITESAAQTLRLPKQKISANINGLGNGQTETSSLQITEQVMPRFLSNFTSTCDLIVLKHITSDISNWSIIKTETSLENNEMQADPTHHIIGPINILLGAGD